MDLAPFAVYDLRRLRKALAQASTALAQSDAENRRQIAIYVVTRLCAELEEYLDSIAPVSANKHAHVEAAVGTALQRLATRLLAGESLSDADLASAIGALQSLR